MYKITINRWEKKIQRKRFPFALYSAKIPLAIDKNQIYQKHDDILSEWVWRCNEVYNRFVFGFSRVSYLVDVGLLPSRLFMLLDNIFAVGIIFVIDTLGYLSVIILFCFWYILLYISYQLLQYTLNYIKDLQIHNKFLEFAYFDTNSDPFNILLETLGKSRKMKDDTFPITFFYYSEYFTARIQNFSIM